MKKTKHKQCASCGVSVNPSNWCRLVTGILLCAKCYWEQN